MNAYLPEIFLGLMGFAMLAYVVLDGFDLGVGILLRRAQAADKDTMVASIGPFWDANETWLVLGVGILLTVFPQAHGEILGALYMPVALMLIGLTLRGVAFDFRTKVKAERKALWDTLFYVGSLLAALAQGFMLGLHIVGYQYSLSNVAFAGFIACALASGYALLGATWLMMKTTGALQAQARSWAAHALTLTGLGIAAVSIATPLVSSRIFRRWFSLPELFWLAPVPLLTLLLFALCAYRLERLKFADSGVPTIAQQQPDFLVWQPFACTVAIFCLAFAGLAYSLFPYLVLDRITIWDAASSTDAMRMIAIGAMVSMPATIGYTIFSYRVFWGKTQPLSYH
jgi:cytochrome bd ubiquinol oxidase subunit II